MIKNQPISSLSFKSIVIYLIPGYFLAIEFIVIIKLIGLNLKLLTTYINNYLSTILIILISLCLGLLLEAIRTMIYPKFIKINRKIPDKILIDLNLYNKLIDMVFLGGNLSYNLVIPVLFNPSFLILIKNKCWAIIFTVVFNILLGILFLYIGYKKEEKFYNFCRRIGNKI